MKKSIFFVLFLIPFSVIAQEGQFKAQSECENHNKFFKTGNYETLQELTDTIYPNGIVYFDPYKVQEYGQEAILDMLQLDEGITFELKGTQQSRFNEQKVYRRFQQYYNGVIVEGGGYSVSSLITGGGNPSVPGPGWGGPCDAVAMVAFYVLTEIGIQTTPTIGKVSLPNILGISNYQTADLVISHNISNGCEYNLAWKVNYFEEGSKISYVDALNGNILKTIEADQRINAPTEIYGTQNLNDFTSGGTTTLVSPDGTIRGFDLSGFNNPAPFTNCQFVEISDFQTNLIPSTTNNQWSVNGAPASLYQGFYVVNLIKGYFNNVNIVFDNINVGVNCNEENAFSLIGSTVQNTFIVIGRNTFNSFATFDIVGHELGHTYLNNFLDYTNAGNASLHEGISDMIGTYAESVFQGSIDWEMGDDIIISSNIPTRDLANPQYSCFNDVINLGSQHDRSTPLGHWFFLITEGSSANNIPSLGIERALEIVLESLNSVGVNADYPDLMAAMLAMVEQDFGRCSREFLAVARAWETICLNTGYANWNGEVPACNYTISGPTVVCEEDDYANFCIQGGLPNAHYRWTIIGGKSTQYTSLKGMQGNIQEGGSCLNITDFPKYPYYPQIITIKVYSPTVGSNYIVRKTIQLNDCNGDDPSCNEYYSSVSPITNEYESLPFELETKEKERTVTFVKVYDTSGRLILTEQYNTFDKNRLKPNQVYVILHLGENGEIINSEKYLRLGY
jgi:hypothetical protein